MSSISIVLNPIDKMYKMYKDIILLAVLYKLIIINSLYFTLSSCYHLINLNIM